MERRFELLAELVRAEDKIRREYGTIQDIENGISEMYEVLYSLKKDFGSNLAWTELMHDLKRIERREMLPKDISTANLLKEIIRASVPN